MNEREIPATGDDEAPHCSQARKPWSAPRVEAIDVEETAAWPLSARFLDGDAVPNTY